MGEHVSCGFPGCEARVHMDDTAYAAGWRVQQTTKHGWLYRCPAHPFPKNT